MKYIVTARIPVNSFHLWRLTLVFYISLTTLIVCASVVLHFPLPIHHTYEMSLCAETGRACDVRMSRTLSAMCSLLLHFPYQNTMLIMISAWLFSFVTNAFSMKKTECNMIYAGNCIKSKHADILKYASSQYQTVKSV